MIFGIKPYFVTFVKHLSNHNVQHSFVRVISEGRFTVHHSSRERPFITILLKSSAVV